MNKSAIQSYCIWARNELIDQVSQRAFEYGISKEDPGDPSTLTVGERVLTPTEQAQRRDFIKKINDKGFHQAIEEVAYTWFNRFIALRFMEVNHYLPSKIRVFSDADNTFSPEILKEVLNLDLEGLDKEKVHQYLEDNDREALYRYLLLTQCNDLNKVLPQMFEEMGSYTELLLPKNILREESVLGRLVLDIPVEDWLEGVEIIGWMYQYYNDERRNEVINIYKGNVKKEDIPAATQLFTTNWVVKYMVDNSLGRYWIERNSQSNLRDKLEYFMESKTGNFTYVDENVKPQDMTFFDPCAGSGHILVYAFDVLMEIYKERGYSERDAASEIVKHNIFGLDIDDRAAQLAYFSVMMKARSYDRRFLNRSISPNVYSIQESNDLGNFHRDGITKDLAKNTIAGYLSEVFLHAKEFGSLIQVEDFDYEGFIEYLNKSEQEGSLSIDFFEWSSYIKPAYLQMAKQAQILDKKYRVVCTNPPYMNKFEANLKMFLNKNYKDYSKDLFSAFMNRNFAFCIEDGYSAFMTPFVWMFIKSYEKLRRFIIENKSISSLIQMEYSAFKDATVPICSFVLKNGKEMGKGRYIRLSEFTGGMEIQRQRVLEALEIEYCEYFYQADQENFIKIPGAPVAYWASQSIFDAFNFGKRLGDVIDPRQGLATTDNNYFLRLWWEMIDIKITFDAISRQEALEKEAKWVPYNKGGPRRQWYGNYDYVVNWTQDGEEIKSNVMRKYPYLNNPYFVVKNMEYYFREAITWPLITSSGFSVRYRTAGGIHDVSGMSAFSDNHVELTYIMGILSTKISDYIFKMLNPTINLQVGDFANFPIIFDNNIKSMVLDIVEEQIQSSKRDWDSFETSWDFKRHPLV